MTTVIDGEPMLECHRPDGTVEYVPIPDTFTTGELDESSEAK